MLFVVVALVVDKLGFNFGDAGNALTQENADLLIKPLGQVNIGSADAPAPAAAKAPTEMTKTDKVLALINEKGYICMGCHQVDAKLMGPAYQDIATKYQGDDKAADMLAAKIKSGGSGTWGEIPMPPNPTVTDDDLKVILDWILTMAKPVPATEEPAKSAEAVVSMDGAESMTDDDKKQLATNATTEKAQPTDAMATDKPAEVATEAVMTTDDAMMLIADKSYACLACHQVDTKMVGPGYKEISAKYQGDAAAVDALIAKIKNGGVGTWGEMPMPPNATVSDDDAKALVTWILSLK
jgi:cytochrome c